MPKVDINNAFIRGESSKRKMASEATSFMTGGINNIIFDKSKLDIRSVPIEKIVPREVNDFSQINVESLAESIRLYGLINPLSVVYYPEEDKYVLSSGHRRYQALLLLHNEYPDEDDYRSVDCAVYELTEDPLKLSQGLPYISKEQEEGIYRDSNLENRQLSYADVARQIRYILKRFDDENYISKIRKRAAEKGVVTRDADFNKSKLIISVLSESHYDGWKKETIRQYLKIQEAGREDLLDQIEQNNLAVSNAYKQVISDQNQGRKRKTHKLSVLNKSVNDFLDEAKKRHYGAEDVKQLEDMIEELQKIVKREKI